MTIKPTHRGHMTDIVNVLFFLVTVEFKEGELLPAMPALSILFPMEDFIITELLGQAKQSTSRCQTNSCFTRLLGTASMTSSSLMSCVMDLLISGSGLRVGAARTWPLD